MTFQTNLTDRFQWGLDIDDLCSYAGQPVPRSTVIPYLVSMACRGGPFALPREPQDGEAGAQAPPSDGCATVDDRSPAHQAEVLAAFLKRSGVDFVRCWFQWNFFEQGGAPTDPGISMSGGPSPDYRFPLDDFVAKMTDAGIGVIGVIGSGYHRFLPTGLQTDHLGAYLKRLTDSSTRIVRHYKDRVKVWQIENEPNWWKAHYSGHWRKGVIWLVTKNQAPILGALHAVVREECPGATILVNLEADDKRTDWRLYSRFSDVLGLDFYPNYARAGPIDASPLRAVASNARRITGLPTFIVETGYPTGPRFFGYDEEKQSRYVRKACEAAFNSDAITGLGWFKFSDSYWKSFPPQENHFGLLTKEGRPKSAWNEFVEQVRQMR